MRPSSPRGAARTRILVSQAASARAQIGEPRHEFLPARVVEVDRQLLGVARALDREDDARAVLGVPDARAALEAGGCRGRRGALLRARHADVREAALLLQLLGLVLRGEVREAPVLHAREEDVVELQSLRRV